VSGGADASSFDLGLVEGNGGDKRGIAAPEKKPLSDAERLG
jgi:hypothetical protein